MVGYSERPFERQDELVEKTARLAELDALLDMNERDNEIVGGEPDEGDIALEKGTKVRDRDGAR